ncbi:predicted protein [Nematostella vectensis]|uniref:Uncharacterized protein n=1 Tax=Nematostella vectensis TaxID=45351 RepID=A7SZE5_NEMVE|nr:predicted protein [Nematostella vectensis]|eukprot:XP_001623021.1 hypothetical protein NEMVEDRAFT_v1g248206 [Nematostella vectensis]
MKVIFSYILKNDPQPLTCVSLTTGAQTSTTVTPSATTTAPATTTDGVPATTTAGSATGSISPTPAASATASPAATATVAPMPSSAPADPNTYLMIKATIGNCSDSTKQSLKEAFDTLFQNISYKLDNVTVKLTEKDGKCMMNATLRFGREIKYQIYKPAYDELVKGEFAGVSFEKATLEIDVKAPGATVTEWKVSKATCEGKCCGKAATGAALEHTRTCTPNDKCTYVPVKIDMMVDKCDTTVCKDYCSSGTPDCINISIVLLFASLLANKFI